MREPDLREGRRCLEPLEPEVAPAVAPRARDRGPRAHGEHRRRPRQELAAEQCAAAVLDVGAVAVGARADDDDRLEREGGGRAAWSAANPPQESPIIPTEPVHQGCDATHVERLADVLLLALRILVQEHAVGGPAPAHVDPQGRVAVLGEVGMAHGVAPAACCPRAGRARLSTTAGTGSAPSGGSQRRRERPSPSESGIQRPSISNRGVGGRAGTPYLQNRPRRGQKQPAGASGPVAAARFRLTLPFRGLSNERGRFLAFAGAREPRRAPVRHARDLRAIRGAGGDPFNPLEGAAPPESLQNELRDYYNLDEPWFVEFWTYVRNIAALHFGPSLVNRNVTVDLVMRGASRPPLSSSCSRPRGPSHSASRWRVAAARRRRKPGPTSSPRRLPALCWSSRSSTSPTWSSPTSPANGSSSRPGGKAAAGR